MLRTRETDSSNYRGPSILSACRGCVGRPDGQGSTWCFLVVLVLLGEVGAARAQGMTEGQRVPNDFPFRVTAEGVRGEPTQVVIRFEIYFPVDGERYLPVSPRLAELFEEAPTVTSGAGFRVRALETKCDPELLSVGTGFGTARVVGGRVRCKLEITPDSDIAPVQHVVTLAFPMVDLVAQKARAVAPSSKAEVHLAIKVWASREAKEQSVREEEEARRRKQELNRQREEARRQEEEARRRESVQRFVKVAALCALAGFVVFLCRNWIWPTFQTTLAPGEHRQFRHRLAVPHDRPVADPGTILSTSWARNRLGRRRRIKVETFVAEDTTTARAPAGRSPVLPKPKAPAQNSHLDLLVSVGVSVPPGTYLAHLSEGAIRITVRDRPAG
jgi:hypothetical protein